MNDFKLQKLTTNWYQINDWQVWAGGRSGAPMGFIYWHIHEGQGKGGWASNDIGCLLCEKEVPVFIKSVWIALVMGMKCE